SPGSTPPTCTSSGPSRPSCCSATRPITASSSPSAWASETTARRGPTERRRGGCRRASPSLASWPSVVGRYCAAVVWVFAVVAALLVFVIAAVTVGRESFRLGHAPPATIVDLDEAVDHVAEALPPTAQARLTYDEVRALIVAQLDHLRSKGLSARPGE